MSQETVVREVSFLAHGPERTPLFEGVSVFAFLPLLFSRAFLPVFYCNVLLPMCKLRFCANCGVWGHRFCVACFLQRKLLFFCGGVATNCNANSFEMWSTNCNVNTPLNWGLAASVCGDGPERTRKCVLHRNKFLSQTPLRA